jgi:hypothetical protein
MKVQVATWPGSGVAGRGLPLAERLGLVSELTQALDLATRSGQEHLMNKVLAILRGELLEVQAPLGGTDLVCLLDAMSELEHEAGRMSPVPNAFNRLARVVIEVLLRASASRSNMSVFSTS